MKLNVIHNSPVYKLITVISVLLSAFVIGTHTIHAQACTLKSGGDANCDNKVDLVDYEQWRREFLTLATTKIADFNNDTRIDLVDYEIWRRNFLGGPIATNTPVPNATLTPTTTPTASNYNTQLAKILSMTHRNKNQDNSPFLQTPSAQLTNEPSLYTNVSDYNGSFFPIENSGQFRAGCQFSHFSYDDPIVYPNKPGAAHLHMFFGNTHVNAYSTYNTIVNSGSSTCNGAELNRTAYWVPALFDGKGNVRVPKQIIYYKSHFGGVGNIETFPDNMQIVNDRHNSLVGTDSQPEFPTFRCNTIYNGGKHRESDTIPSCESTYNGEPGALDMLISFDYCWNGQDPSNFKQNLTAPPKGRWFLQHECPSTHPHILPNLQYHIVFPIEPGDDTTQWYLSSDVNHHDGTIRTHGSTAHADWFGGWNKEVNRIWVANCTNVSGADCADGTLGDPRFMPNAKALKKIAPYNGPRKIPVAEIYRQICQVPKTITKDTDAAYCDKQYLQ